MTQENGAIKEEEVIFFIDLLSNFLKKKTLEKGIKSFVIDKQKFNIPCSFGIVLFLSERSPINVYDKPDSKAVIEAIDDTWKERELNQSYFENGLFEVLSYIFGEVKRGSQKSYRVIIISDTPSHRSDDYHTAVYDLIVKAKNFSTQIDIIRIGENKFYEDEVKLKVITSETQGGIFFCNDDKHFLDVLSSLVKNRLEFNVVRGQETGLVLTEDKTFYERLAADLISLENHEEEICDICNLEVCPHCGAFTDEIRKCFNCNSRFHGCCSALYSLSENVGFIHIFKCPRCETLLQLDEELVKMIYQEEYGEEVSGEIEVIEESSTSSSSRYSYDAYDDDDDTEEEPIEEPIIEPKPEEQIESPPTNIDALRPPPGPPVKEESPQHPPEIPSELNKTIKIGGFFGRDIEVKSQSFEAKKPAKASKPPSKPLKTQPQQAKEPPNSITELKPPRRKKLKFCKICGSLVKNVGTCPQCGAKID